MLKQLFFPCVHACGQRICHCCCQVNSRNQLLRTCLLLNMQISTLCELKLFVREAWGSWRLIADEYLIDKLSVYFHSLLSFGFCLFVCFEWQISAGWKRSDGLIQDVYVVFLLEPVGYKTKMLTLVTQPCPVIQQWERWHRAFCVCIYNLHITFG